MHQKQTLTKYFLIELYCWSGCVVGVTLQRQEIIRSIESFIHVKLHQTEDNLCSNLYQCFGSIQFWFVENNGNAATVAEWQHSRLPPLRSDSESWPDLKWESR